MQTTVPSERSCLSSPPEGVWACVCGCACVWSALHTVHILPSKSWPVFSSRADMPGLPGVHTRRRAPPPPPPHPTPGPSHQWKLSWLCDFWEQASAYLSCPVVTRWPPAPWSLSAYCFNPLSALSTFPPLSVLALALKDLFRTRHAQTVAQFSIACAEPPGWVLLMLLRTVVVVHEPCGPPGAFNPWNFIYYKLTVTSYFMAAWWRHHFVLHVFLLSFCLWSKLPLMESSRNSVVPSLVFELVSNILLNKKSARVLAFRSHVILHQ